MAKGAKLVKIHNVETGEIIEREMNAEELAQSTQDELNDAAMKAAIEQAKADKIAVLEQLGITEAQAKLLLS